MNVSVRSEHGEGTPCMGDLVKTSGCVIPASFEVPQCSRRLRAMSLKSDVSLLVSPGSLTNARQMRLSPMQIPWAKRARHENFRSGQWNGGLA